MFPWRFEGRAVERQRFMSQNNPGGYNIMDTKGRELKEPDGFSEK